MPLVLIDILYGLVMAVAGAASVWLLRKYAGDRSTRAAQHKADCAREVLNSLQELAARVSIDVGEHGHRVQEFNEELKSVKVPEADAMMGAVAGIVRANEQMQRRLTAAETKLQEQAKTIELQATEVRTDALTRLINRHGFDTEMNRRFAEFQRHGASFCVMIIDLDYFKVLNDQHGHQAGDEVLRGVAAILRRTMRDVDLVARYGGEEFTVVMPRTSIGEARTPAERAREAIEHATFRFEGTDLSITASIGVAQLLSSEHPALLLRRADEALYASKEAGRNNTHWHDGRAVHPVDRDEKPATPEDAAAKQQPKRQQLEERSTEPREPVPVVQSDETDSAVSSKLQDDVRTRLGDRTGFCQAVRQRLAEWKRGGVTFSLILMEIDISGQIVQQHGYEVETLRDTVALSVVSVVRDMDLVARYSPDCLAFLFPDVEHGVAIDVAGRLHQAVGECALLQKDAERKLTVSLGLAETATGDDMVRLLRRAEEALRCAKESGNNSSYYHNGQWPEPVGATAGVSD